MWFLSDRGWIPTGVASQKIGPVASDIARFARPYTFWARKDPQSQWVSGLDPSWALGWIPGSSCAVRPARASPEYIPFLTPSRAFCLIENCPADTFLLATGAYAPAASSITRRFDMLRLNRRLLSVSAMTEIPNCQCW